ncbi:AraC family transcriptional regulator [Paenibacillus tarimensis]|uniref:AraC family transcriptional regulator n=1 Tax=Paenibacillus tarimensis TaxID=416012 RepID=UPI001F48F4BF|nr:AraC family transcriptional regulator [Paenibacillus tarimensis]MCF2945383.1 AraC family transcriptional regulator [Paenibacillus tarimensis]
MMPFLLAEFANMEHTLPLYVCCVGSHEQKWLERPDGYHAHQLFLSRSGQGTFRIEGQPDLTLTPDTMLLLPAGVPHAYFPDQSSDRWDLGFAAFNGHAAGPLVEQMAPYARTVLTTSRFDKLWDQLESLWQLISLNGEQSYWEASKRMYDMMVTLLEGISADKKSPAKPAVSSGVQHPGLQTAVKLIHDHYNERLLLANVARAAGYSPQHFHRLFAASYGMTPQHYILQLRMRTAAQLLKEDPSVSVERVAESLGMETSYFIRMFKRTYGETPKRFRDR